VYVFEHCRMIQPAASTCSCLEVAISTCRTNRLHSMAWRADPVRLTPPICAVQCPGQSLSDAARALENVQRLIAPPQASVTPEL
jgi:hypothetical protein